MRKEVFEQRAAEMRARLSAGREGTLVQKGRKPAERKVAAPVEPTPVVPGLPVIEPYQMLAHVWKVAYTKALLEALPFAHTFVMRTVRRVGTLQVGYDGLLSLGGEEALDVNVNLASLVPALRLYGILIERIRALGGKVELARNGTLVRFRGETERVRLREGTIRHAKPTADCIYGGYTYEATGLLYFVLLEESGGKHKTLVRTPEDVDVFVRKLQNAVTRRPSQRAEQEERQRAWQVEHQRREEQSRLRAEAERQHNAEQQHFDTLYKDVTRWQKAVQIRSYLDASATEYERRHGKIPTGSKADGWFRWLYYYAERLDPLTNCEGPSQQPEGFPATPE